MQSRGKKRGADAGEGGGAKKAKSAGVSFLLPDGSANMAALKADAAEELVSVMLLAMGDAERGFRTPIVLLHAAMC